MNRRNLFKLAAGAATALILPPTLAENAEAGKRFWALGAMPQPRQEMGFSSIDRYETPWNADDIMVLYDRNDDPHLVKRSDLTHWGWSSTPGTGNVMSYRSLDDGGLYIFANGSRTGWRIGGPRD